MEGKNVSKSGEFSLGKKMLSLQGFVLVIYCEVTKANRINNKERRTTVSRLL